jgi:hypothetical protein
MSDIKEAESAKAQLQEELAQHQSDRDEAKAAMAKATAIREKEAAAFAKEQSEDKANIEALIKATKAIEKGMAGGFLQTTSAAVLRRLTMSTDISNTDRDLSQHSSPTVTVPLQVAKSWDSSNNWETP